jgi:CheY-like chemotaxis protein/HPt (histidine-containing phosphotransfer) domain-containing protein
MDRQKPSPARRRRILIAEDNLINQNVLLKQVENLGYQADVVVNGSEALDALTRVRYALVLMDCQMPIVDGLTATAEIRRRERGRRHTPIIGVTANVNREQCLDAGMDDYLRKPLRQSDLAKAITRWIARQPPKGSPRGNRERPSKARTKAAADDSLLDSRELNSLAQDENAYAFSDATLCRRLAELREECGAEIVAGFIGMFVKDTRERLTRLHGLAGEQDSAAVEREAHSLKGSCANLGVHRLAALSHQLETDAEAGSLKTVNESLRGLDSEFERLKPLLSSLRDSLS